MNLRKESPQDLEEWKVADAAEWAKVAPVRVLSLEESRQVRAKLQARRKTSQNPAHQDSQKI